MATKKAPKYLSADSVAATEEAVPEGRASRVKPSRYYRLCAAQMRSELSTRSKEELVVLLTDQLIREMIHSDFDAETRSRRKEADTKHQKEMASIDAEKNAMIEQAFQRMQSKIKELRTDLSRAPSLLGERGGKARDQHKKEEARRSAEEYLRQHAKPRRSAVVKAIKSKVVAYGDAHNERRFAGDAQASRTITGWLTKWFPDHFPKTE